MIHRAIIEFADCQSDCSEFFYNKMKNYDIVYRLKVGDNRNKILSNVVYDTVIMLNNANINYSYAFNMVKEYIRKRKDIITYYNFTNKDMDRLSDYAHRVGINIFFYYARNTKRELYPINIPVFFITGMGINCSQFDMHLKLCNVLETKRMKVLNYTNSIYSDLFDFVNINNLEDMNFNDVIASINHKITLKIAEIKPDVIIISDVGGLQPYNAVINNNYGIYNNIWKYACPYDYVFYNIYATEYDSITFDEIMNKVLCSVNKSTLCLGLGHTAPTMAIAGLSDNDDFIEVISEEYNKIMTCLKNISRYEVIDPRSESDVEAYINKLMSS